MVMRGGHSGPRGWLTELWHTTTNDSINEKRWQETGVNCTQILLYLAVVVIAFVLQQNTYEKVRKLLAGDNLLSADIHVGQL